MIGQLVCVSTCMLFLKSDRTFFYFYFFFRDAHDSILAILPVLTIYASSVNTYVEVFLFVVFLGWFSSNFIREVFFQVNGGLCVTCFKCTQNGAVCGVSSCRTYDTPPRSRSSRKAKRYVVIDVCLWWQSHASPVDLVTTRWGHSSPSIKSS